VIAMIYESRPNVTVDAAALTLKAGNAVVLRGGSEALSSNAFLAGLISRTLKDAGLNPDAATFIRDPDREVIPGDEAQPDLIDLIFRARQFVEGRAGRIGSAAAAAFRRYLPQPTSIGRRI